MKLMNLTRKDFRIYKKTCYLLPTVIIYVNEPIFMYNNFSIEFHWLIFHGRLLYEYFEIKKEKKHDKTTECKKQD